jgi:hypothetical protein
LPLISAGPASGKILVRVTPVNPSTDPAQVQIEEIDLVTDLESGRVNQPSSKQTFSESGWRLTLPFEGEGVQIGDLGVMHIELVQEGGASESVLVEAEVGSTNVTTCRVEFSGIRDRTVLATGLGPLRGSRIRSVSLSGNGSGPATVSAVVSLYPGTEDNANLY